MLQIFHTCAFKDYQSWCCLFFHPPHIHVWQHCFKTSRRPNGQEAQLDWHCVAFLNLHAHNNLTRWPMWSDLPRMGQCLYCHILIMLISNDGDIVSGFFYVNFGSVSKLQDLKRSHGIYPSMWCCGNTSSGVRGGGKHGKKERRGKSLVKPCLIPILGSNCHGSNSFTKYFCSKS